MNSSFQRTLLWASVIIPALAITVVLFTTNNSTASLPVGLYISLPTLGATPHPGDTIKVFSPFLNANLLKQVAATAPPYPYWTSDGQLLSGLTSMPIGTFPYPFTGTFVPPAQIPFSHYAPPKTGLFLYSPNLASFDSRYYGTIPPSTIKAFTYPLFTDRQQYFEIP